MLLFGMSYICLQIFQLIGISHTHFLSYNPNFAVYKNAPLTLACMLAVHFIDYIDFYARALSNTDLMYALV